jgi:hypothetical protein
VGINLGISKLVDITPYTDIFAGLHPNMEVSEVVILAGQNLKRGSCLGIISAAASADKGKYKLWDIEAEDGTEDLIGILGCDVDATDADGKGFIYVHGEFLLGGLTAKETIKAGVYNGGTIVIMEEKP